MPRERVSLTNRRIGAGEFDRTLTLPTTFADRDLSVTLTVDDPVVDPPTDADLTVHVDAERDGEFLPVTTFVVLASGTTMHYIPTYGRTLRIRYSCGIACRIDLLAVGYP